MKIIMPLLLIGLGVLLACADSEEAPPYEEVLLKSQEAVAQAIVDGPLGLPRDAIDVFCLDNSFESEPAYEFGCLAFLGPHPNVRGTPTFRYEVEAWKDTGEIFRVEFVKIEGS